LVNAELQTMIKTNR